MSEILSLKTRAADVGGFGEDEAARFLEANGYRLVMRNFKVPIGRNTVGAQVTGEIDVIAVDGETLCFIEVKTRSSDDFAPIIAAVDRRKQRQITRTARVYRKMMHLTQMPIRFDVVTVLLQSGPPKIELTKAFWTESKFKKKTWSGDPYYNF
jgi:putative endonuclease